MRNYVCLRKLVGLHSTFGSFPQFFFLLACRTAQPNGYGSKLKQQGTAGFSPWFHLLGFQNGYPFLTHSQMVQSFRSFWIEILQDSGSQHVGSQRRRLPSDKRFHDRKFCPEMKLERPSKLVLELPGLAFFFLAQSFQFFQSNQFLHLFSFSGSGQRQECGPGLLDTCKNWGQLEPQ